MRWRTACPAAPALLGSSPFFDTQVRGGCAAGVVALECSCTSSASCWCITAAAAGVGFVDSSAMWLSSLLSLNICCVLVRSSMYRRILIAHRYTRTHLFSRRIAPLVMVRTTRCTSDSFVRFSISVVPLAPGCQVLQVRGPCCLHPVPLQQARGPRPCSALLPSRGCASRRDTLSPLIRIPFAVPIGAFVLSVAVRARWND